MPAFRRLPVPLLLASALASCAGGAGTAAPAPGLPAGHPVVAARALPDDASPDLTTGVVQETLEGGGYTYARLAVEGGERWVAGPPAPLSVGDTVSLSDMVSMGAFSSQALRRSFDPLYFTGAFRTPGGEALGAAAEPPAVRTEHEGVVKQALRAGSYVYLEVEADGSTKWLAAPITEVREGDRVGWTGGSPMKDFSSPTLGRTFADILFVGGVVVLP